MNKWLQKKNIVERISKQIALCFEINRNTYDTDADNKRLSKLFSKVYDMEFKECVVDYIHKFDIKEQEIVIYRRMKDYENADKARLELIRWDWEAYERKDNDLK